MIKHVELTNKQGKTLRGYLDLPTNFNGEIVVMYHGFTGNKSEHGYHFRNFARMISDKGFASLRMDFFGNAESDGEFKDFTMDTLMDDAKLIFDYACSIDKVTKVDVLGFSMGGAVASMLSVIYQNKINKMIMWSAAANICELIRHNFDNGEKLENGNVLSGCFEISKEMYDSTYKYDPMKDISKYTNPVLLIHGRNDVSVNYLYTMRYSVTFYNAIVHIINGAGHGYDRISERDELYSKSLDFLLKDYTIK